MDQMLIQALRNKNSLCENSTVNVCEKFTWYHCHDQLISQNGNIGSDSVFHFWILGLLVLFTTCTVLNQLFSHFCRGKTVLLTCIAIDFYIGCPLIFFIAFNL